MDELASYYDKPIFWSPSYFICTVSDCNAAAVKRYIQDQDIQ
ncbi:transposase [Erysipelotrichaceae bacterium RD49]|nr:transposase [Erysipelotrichaceae bacterium RD49]